MKLIQFATMILLVIALAACGQNEVGPQGAMGPQGPTASLPAPTPAPVNDPNQNAINAIISQANALREAQGSSLLRNGLTCSLYTVPTSTVQIIGATLTGVGSFSYIGTFNVANGPTSDGLDILPAGMESVYQTWYVVKCSGQLVITGNGWHGFDISSDDGSNLYVDGLLINNDGLHGAVTKTASKFLAVGTHSFEVDYFQGQGAEELIVNMDGKLIPSANMFH